MLLLILLLIILLIVRVCRSGVFDWKTSGRYTHQLPRSAALQVLDSPEMPGGSEYRITGIGCLQWDSGRRLTLKVLENAMVSSRSNFVMFEMRSVILITCQEKLNRPSCFN